jgi:hypothetical protein
MIIKHLKYTDIDFEKWDETISSSLNRLSYAYSWYLDIVSPNWEALITPDYRFVMPLTVKKKYKLPYIVQPVLTQQLGIFSKEIIDNKVINSFIRKIPYYSYELNLNEANNTEETELIPNYILNLNRPYGIIKSGFSKNTLRNIDKCAKLKLKTVDKLPVDDFIGFYESAETKFNKVDITLLRELLESGITREKIVLKGVRSNEDRLIAVLCLLISGGRITYLLPVSNAEGKEKFAMFYLVNEIIKSESGNDKILDFEGSKIDGIARFYRGFGAINNPYTIIKQLRPSFLVGRI